MIFSIIFKAIELRKDIETLKEANETLKKETGALKLKINKQVYFNVSLNCIYCIIKVSFILVSVKMAKGYALKLEITEL